MPPQFTRVLILTQMSWSCEIYLLTQHTHTHTWLLSVPLLNVTKFWWFNGKPISWQKAPKLPVDPTRPPASPFGPRSSFPGSRADPTMIPLAATRRPRGALLFEFFSFLVHPLGKPGVLEGGNSAIRRCNLHKNSDWQLLFSEPKQHERKQERHCAGTLTLGHPKLSCGRKTKLGRVVSLPETVQQITLYIFH